MSKPNNFRDEEVKDLTRFTWLRILLRYLWYLLLLVLIIILFQGPEKGFRYLGL